MGGGNTGIVYKAYDNHNRRTVALKILPNDLLLSDEKKARFLRESRAAIMLEHESIAQLLEIGEYHQCSYIAMEFVDGKTFGELLEDYPEGVELPFFYKLIMPVVSGVAYAHRLGLVHRDLKPENLKLTERGQPVVLDFGLVKFLDDDSNSDEGFKTLTGMVLGSARYMSPEQAAGDVMDARTDVFSLGIIMYELVSGKNPFRAKSPFVTMQRILNDDPVSLELLRPGIPAQLGKIVGHCLSKNKQERYTDAAGLYSALEASRG